MSFDFWVVAPLSAAAATTFTALAALVRRGLPSGRVTLFLLLLSVTLPLLWLAGLEAGYEGIFGGKLETAVVTSVVALPTLLLAFSVRFGQRATHFVRGGLVPLTISAVASISLAIWQARSTGLGVIGLDDGEILLALAPGPSRAAAVALLLAGCYGVVRLQAVLEASRRAGLVNLARATVGPLFGSVALVLTTSQLLLYGALPFRLLAFGALALIPISITLTPLLLQKQDADPLLPESATLQTSSLLLLGLGLFLTALAAGGEMIHQFLPDQGRLWFRWGGAIILVSFAVLSVLPMIRRPLSEYFDRSLYANRWDFRGEWGRVNDVMAPTGSLEETLGRLREYLEGIFGPIGLVLWMDEGEADWRPVTAGASDLPALARNNPLRHVDIENEQVIECKIENSRLHELPLIVENIDLVETLGFRVFLPLVRHGTQFALIGVALPHGNRLDSDHRALLRNVTGQLANNLTWRDLPRDRRDFATGSTVERRSDDN
jgi:cadmium resistance protein CadD (predicted permease)